MKIRQKMCPQILNLTGSQLLRLILLSLCNGVSGFIAQVFYKYIHYQRYASLYNYNSLIDTILALGLGSTEKRKIDWLLYKKRVIVCAGKKRVVYTLKIDIVGILQNNNAILEKGNLNHANELQAVKNCAYMAQGHRKSTRKNLK